MGGLFYHFVIGNGTQSRDGQIEVGWRWKKHVKANRPFDIQICLVGDFNQQRVSDAQYASLVTLIQTLRADYCITVDNVRRHEDIPGKHTACPGDRFPFSRLIQELS
jgi:N-acetyl-anhydromuramyl-L-alanine amidase AmpD